MAKNNSYIRPQSEVYQLLSTTISQTNGHGIACLIGSQYDVYRIGIEDVPTATLGDNLEFVVTEGDSLNTYTIDEDSITYVVSDALAMLEPSASTTFLSVTDSPLKYAAVDGLCFAKSSDATGTEKRTVDNYNVSVGDLVVGKHGSSNEFVVATITKVESSKNDGVYDTITVNKVIPSNYTKHLAKSYSGELTDVYSFDDTTNTAKQEGSTDQLGITFKGINNEDVTATLAVGAGKVQAAYRVRVTSALDSEDGILKLNSISDIQNTLGSIDVNNELAYACYRAMVGSQGRQVYAVRVTADNAAAFTKAMEKTESNTNVYAFVPVTANPECMKAVVDFNETMASPINKKWRITLVGADLDVRTKVTKDNSGVALQCNIDKNGMLIVDEENCNNGFSFHQFSVGDKVTVSSKEYKITSIIAENAVQLDLKPSSEVTLAQFSISRSDTAQANIATVKNLANTFNNRRAVVVWCDNGKSAGVTIPNVYLAAEIAGLTSALLPQQGLTNTEITTIDSAPRMYTRYTQAQLDDVASHGALIVTQDSAADAVYIRHQLTTSSDKGILYSELSCTRNLDNISYAVADLIKTYVGKYNITNTAIESITTDIQNLLDSYTSNSTNSLIGPALVRYENLSVVQDPVALDRVVVNVDYHLPAPLNRISVYQMAYVAQLTIGQ